MSAEGEGRGIVIVGAGQAGGRTAQALRARGFAGPITLIGDEHIGPYERPPLSKDVLLGRVSPEALHLLTEQGWKDLKIDLRLESRVIRIERSPQRVVLSDCTTVPYSSLVLATGARARPFPGNVQANSPIHYLRSLRDAIRLRSRLTPQQKLTIIGAGFVGLELAASARTLGVEVTLVEAAPRVLARLLPNRFASWLADLHVDRGVKLRFSKNVSSINLLGVHLDDGSFIESDTVVIGIGALPNDELAADAQLKTGLGVVIDEQCRSDDPNIYAIGDVACSVNPVNGSCSRLESWRNAEAQAATVAAVLCGDAPPPSEVPWFWTDQYDRNIQLAGWPADDLNLVEIGDPQNGPYLAYFMENAILRGVIGIDCGREVRAAQKIIHQGLPIQASDLPRPRMRKPIRPVHAASLTSLDGVPHV